MQKSITTKSLPHQYHTYLRTVDLGWIESVFHDKQFGSDEPAHGVLIAQSLWSLISQDCSDCIVELRSHKVLLGELIPSGLDLPALKMLHIRVDAFDDSEASTILNSCPNLKKLHISTCKLYGTQLARAITNLNQNSLKELYVKCERYTSIHLVMDALVNNQKASLTSLTFDVDQLHMSRCEQDELDLICGAIMKLKECSKLQKLILRGFTPVNDECIAPVFDRGNQLQQVQLQGSDISNLSWDRLLTRSSMQLRVLTLQSNEGTITSLLPSLRKHVHELHSLDITSMTFSAPELQYVLAGCPNLEQLYLGHFKETEVCMGDRLVYEITARCPKIHTLNLGNLNFTRHGLLRLTNHSCLKQVIVSKLNEKHIGNDVSRHVTKFSFV
ncbi:hypothetical protein K7432_016742 [Basidiobolus ranarum]|uniref:Uncharacterized protein n=1 Tax=Basidiobolus ranarum TaxID=34480 RepID=A0ABR2VL87_9FUNG